jgi:hypothetical protein
MKIRNFLALAIGIALSLSAGVIAQISGGGVEGGGRSPQGSAFATQYKSGNNFAGAGPGTAGNVLTSNGAAAAPTFQAASGGTPGTPLTSVQFNSASAFAGDAGFLFVAASDTLTIGEVGQAGTLKGADNGAGVGVALTVQGGAGNGGSAGGSITNQGGTAGATGTGGNAFLIGGTGGGTSGNAGSAQVRGGTSTAGNGGDAILEGRGGAGNGNGGNANVIAGLKAGSGTNGVINFQVQSGTTKAQFDGNGNFITKQAIADQSYSYQTPTTGFAITIADNISQLILDPAGTLATGTITMPATPIDGQIVCVSDSQVQTALTVSPNTAQSIKNAPTSLTAGGRFCYQFRITNTTWYIH